MLRNQVISQSVMVAVIQVIGQTNIKSLGTGSGGITQTMRALLFAQ